MSQPTELVIDPGHLETVSATVTGMPIYTDRAGTTAASFPATITTTTTYYAGIGNVSVTMTSEGMDVTGTATGTRVVTLTGGRAVVTAAADSTDLVNTSCTPWRHHIFPGDPAAANTNFSTVTIFATLQAFNIYLTSSGAQNAEVSYNVALGAGTWTLTLYHSRDTNRGIYTVTLGGVAAGTIDGYAAAGDARQDSLTGIVIPTTAVHSLNILMATKNASSSSYVGLLNAITLTRTA